MEKWYYYGLFLDKPSYIKLIEVLRDYDLIDKLEECDKEFLEHCTLLHVSQAKDNYDLYEYLNDRLGESFEIAIDGIGYSDKAMAFRVNKNTVVSANNTPHITICTFNGGKPVDSNRITNWFDLDENVIVRTTLLRK